MKAQKLQVYKCGHSNLTVEILTESDECFKIECCGEEMVLLEEKTADAATEKHVPIASAAGNGIKVVVGSTPHPMTEEHYIQWIEVVNCPWVNRKYLKPGDAPEAEFYVPLTDTLVIRSYCNVHGLWKG
jgi:superoxide reductase